MQNQKTAVRRRKIHFSVIGALLFAGALFLSGCQALLLPHMSAASGASVARTTASGSTSTSGTASTSGSTASASDPVSLSWTASSDPTVTGYIVHWGTSSGSYTNSIDVGNTTQYLLSGLNAYAKYYIAVTAYNAAGLQSSDSNEVSSLSAASDVTPTSVTASSNDGDVPANTLDGNLSTRWSAYGDGQWIQYDLGKVYTLRYLAIAFYEGDTRAQSFDIDLSTDGTNWTTVYSGSSSGTTTALETFPIPATSAEYVRIVGHGNSVNLWNSLTEVHIGGYSSPSPVSSAPAPSILTPASVTASSNDGDVPANTLDGSLSTRWSAQGDGQWIQYDLGKSYTLSSVAIAFYEGTTRTQSFDIDLSTDGTTWTQVYSGSSSGTTDNLQTFQIPATSAEYLRIVCNGNSVNTWNSLTEVQIGGY